VGKAETGHEAPQELATVRDFLRWAVSAFNAAGVAYGHGTDDAWDEARWLVTGALHLPFDSPDWVLDARLGAQEREHVATLLRRRVAERMPTAYLLGEAWFAGLRFRVDPSVLIPRSPIAELIAAYCEPWLDGREPRRILDLCCGSGCIGIAAALAWPRAEVDLSDISPAALELAHENVALHGLEERVRVIESDLFEALAGEVYDLILTNPPYVDQAEMAALPAEFLHEPRLGLAAGADGLDIARRIIAAAPEHLGEKGLLVLEVGHSADALERAFPELPFLWPDFTHGGHGVALIHADELRERRRRQ
jgi:ribosomal protein L3 glutamine methyltransferase